MAGGLMAIGPGHYEGYYGAATYVDKILHGAKPADLPIAGPTQFTMSANRTALKNLGLSLPSDVAARVDDRLSRSRRSLACGRMSLMGQTGKAQNKQMFSGFLPKADFPQPFSAARPIGRLSSRSDAGPDAARFCRAHHRRAPRSRYAAAIEITRRTMPSPPSRGSGGVLPPSQLRKMCLQ